MMAIIMMVTASKASLAQEGYISISSTSKFYQGGKFYHELNKREKSLKIIKKIISPQANIISLGELNTAAF
jgi:hypothetical protein